jgi:hypothetical protein
MINDFFEGEDKIIAQIDEFPNNCGIAIISKVVPAHYYIKEKEKPIKIRYDLIFHMAFTFIYYELTRSFVYYSAAENQISLIEYLNNHWENCIELGRNPNSNNIIYTWTKDLRNYCFL